MMLNSAFGFAVIIFSAFCGFVGMLIFHKIIIKKKMNAFEMNISKLKDKNKFLQRGIKMQARKLDAYGVAIHKYNNRLNAFEHNIANFIKKEKKNNYKEKLDSELTDILDEISKLTEQMQIAFSNIGETKLPSTNIRVIDSLFNYYSSLCRLHNISFQLNIDDELNTLIKQKMISCEKLEVLIGDHLKNALDAVMMSDDDYRSILVHIMNVDGCCNISFFDSGIPFEADTLKRLGFERVTTHKDKGGHGIGFMTTFETIRECNASLVINEKKPDHPGHKKIVAIRFDNMNRYVIETYRPEAFPKSKRYEIVSL